MVPSEDNTNVEWVCENHPQRVAGLFSSLDLERKGMERVKAAVEEKHWPAACRALLAYYSAGASGHWYRKEPVKQGDGTDPAAEKIRKDVFNFQTMIFSGLWH
jgi:hypothetical protein